jgi:cysteine desulfurase / selenocysteine lyase
MKPTLSMEMLKQDFPILKRDMSGKNLIYLDSAASSQKPQQVIDAVKNFYENNNANIHRGVYKLSEESTIAYEEAHKKVADLINATPEEIIFTSGTTHSLNLLAYSLGKELKEGDEIVLTQLEHHANLVPWQQIAKEKNLKLNYIRINPDCSLDIDHAKELITEKTKIVSVTHVSNAIGTIIPIRQLEQLTHAVNAYFVVDGAQSVPHMPVDVKELNVDFMAFSGHKMLAPTGIGALYGKKEILEKISPFMYGGDMISEVTWEDSTWNELPMKFEAGTPNIAGAIGFGIAAEYLKAADLESIHRHTKDLAEYTRDRLNSIPGVTIHGPKDTTQRSNIVSFTVEGLHPHDISSILSQEGVCVRGGHHCAMPLMKLLQVQGTTRASFYLYNSYDDVENLVLAVEKAIQTFKK